MIARRILIVALLAPQTLLAQETIPLLIRGQRPIPLALALEAAQKAVAVCAAAKTGIVVDVYDYSYGLRVTLQSDGYVESGAVDEARRNAEAVLKSGSATGGALAFRRGDTPRAVISVAGAWNETLGSGDPALDLKCAQAGLDAVKDRL